MTRLYAQPYDNSATGFYFEDYEEYQKQAAVAANEYGDRVEEFEIQFIDGSIMDFELSNAWSVNQANVYMFLNAVDAWEDSRKINYIIAVGECGYSHEQIADDPEGVEIDLYHVDSLKQLAEQFVDDGLFGEIPSSLQFYIDYEAISRDLGVDYTQTIIAGEHYAYRCW